MGTGRRGLGLLAAVAAGMALLVALATAALGGGVRAWAGPLAQALLPGERVALADRRVLLLSDEPETVPAQGILYRDVVRGPFRVFLYAVNGTAGALYPEIVVSNLVQRPNTVQVTRAGVGGPGADDVAVAAQAQHAFDVAATRETLRLGPDASALLLPRLSREPAAPGQLVTAIVDATATAPLLVSTVASAAPIPDDLGLLPVLAPARPPGALLRGTFPGADLAVQLSVFPWQSEVALGAATTGEAGYSRVDRQSVVDRGDYGVRFTVTIRQYRGTPAAMAALALLRSLGAAGYLLPCLLPPPLLWGIVRGQWQAAWQALAAAARRWRGQLVQAVLETQWMPPAAVNLPAVIRVQLG